MQFLISTKTVGDKRVPYPNIIAICNDTLSCAQRCQGRKRERENQVKATSCSCLAPSCLARPWRPRRNGCASAVAGSACPRACCPHPRPFRRTRCAVGLCSVKSVKCKRVQTMLPFNSSYRNKNEPTAIYPSLGYSPPRKEIKQM